MTDDLNIPEENEQDNSIQIEDELQTLKARADIMGLKYHPSIGLDKLRDKVHEQLASDNTESKEEVSKPAIRAKKTHQLSKRELQLQYHTRLRREANCLRRVRITCMNPNKKNWPGEIFTVGNSVIGTIKKFVPFNAEAGYHVPHMIYTHLKTRKFQKFTPVKQANGRTTMRSSMVPEFAIEDLEPLTQEELTDLATQQAVNRSID